MKGKNQDNITTLDEKKLGPFVRMGISTAIGTREQQQDAVLAFGKKQYQIAAVCDGMGGLEGGELASKTAVNILAQDFLELADHERPDISLFLRNEAKKLDQAVSGLKDETGERLNAGTTIVAAIMVGDRFYWMSVGDSRIFYIANNRIFSITREHNYRLSLNILRERRKISAADYETELKKGEALISYIGMGNLNLIDGNTEAIVMKKGDMALLCSDGLYKTISDGEILEIISGNRNVQEAAEALTRYCVDHAAGSQDNTSVVLIHYT